ncbi:hypothetical protein Xekk_04477 [Xenorhabdus sp. KK7.4]|nr:hypothetical protein Xekk_04477 [Xenorhabdus sp. KK7.4]
MSVCGLNGFALPALTSVMLRVKNSDNPSCRENSPTANVSAGTPAIVQTKRNPLFILIFSLWFLSCIP